MNILLKQHEKSRVYFSPLSSETAENESELMFTVINPINRKLQCCWSYHNLWYVEILVITTGKTQNETKANPPVCDDWNFTK